MVSTQAVNQPTIHGVTHRNHVCVVDKDQLRLTSSVVVTFVQVMHNETTCPASSARVKRRVQMLAKRAQVLLMSAAGEVKSIGGRIDLTGAAVSSAALSVTVGDKSGT